jgi:hypothetical protein
MSTGVPPVTFTTSKTVVRVEERENREPKTVEPTAKPIALPTPEADAHGQAPNSGTHGGQVGKSGRVCKDCGQPLLRNVNHFLSCPIAKGRSDMDEYLGDMLSRPKPFEGIGETMEFEDRDWGLSPFDRLLAKGATTSKQGREGDAAKQKGVQSVVMDERTTATATPRAQSPDSAAPLYFCMVCYKVPVRSSTSDHCTDCWNNGKPYPIPKGAMPQLANETTAYGY